MYIYKNVHFCTYICAYIYIYICVCVCVCVRSRFNPAVRAAAPLLLATTRRGM